MVLGGLEGLAGMITVNENYLKLTAGYLFPEVGRRVASYVKGHPEARVIRLGIGDVTEAVPAVCVAAMKEGAEELGAKATLRGYGPEQGYEFLRAAIAEHDFKARGVEVGLDEIFVSDGSKCDTGNIQEIFGLGNTVAVQDPAYPVYVDTNVMAGRTGEADKSGRYKGIVYLPCTPENDFTPAPPQRPVDMIYLCYPNNPTGAVATKTTLAQWVEYAQENRALILFDAAYEAFIRDEEVVHSIYEVAGAKQVAIEFRSYSKSAGFTGVRCAYTVVPKELKAFTVSGEPVDVNGLWNRRHCTKFNGVSYPVQRAAAATYTPQGKVQVRALTDYYMENARIIRERLGAAGFAVYGGVNAPYIWVGTPGGMSSWEFFDKLLSEAQVVGTPGSGFGPAGEGYFRFSAFGDRANVEEALGRIEAMGV